MNLSPKKLLFVILSSVVVLTGCTKKPKRPSPDQTVLGTGAGAGGGLSGESIPTDNLAPGTGLEARPPGVLEDEFTIRGLLEPVYFAFDQSAIQPAERAKIAAAQKYLVEHPDQGILFEGHCDWRGTPEYNLGLGDRRAAAAKNYLASLGVAAAKIETLSKGDLEAQENAAADVMAKDRKVEIVILKAKK